jgi:hypothetical protein
MLGYCELRQLQEIQGKFKPDFRFGVNIVIYEIPWSNLLDSARRSGFGGFRGAFEKLTGECRGHANATLLFLAELSRALEKRESSEIEVFSVATSCHEAYPMHMQNNATLTCGSSPDRWYRNFYALFHWGRFSSSTVIAKNNKFKMTQ